MKLVCFLMLFVLLAGTSFSFTGVQQENWQTKELSDLPGMSTEGAKYMLGVQEIDGVKGIAYLNDVRKVMAKYGLKQTHHIMVEFRDVVSGDAIKRGAVEVVVEGPYGNISETIKLFTMDGSFGADITLNKKGDYQFNVTTSFADGRKLTFDYHYKNK